MKSIGETLKEAREGKGISIQQVAMDLNISKEYLAALENEEFDIFPAEAYLLGFLRNYSEFLGLDVEKNITLYKNYKISEEPAPLEELVGQQRSSSLPLRFLLILLVLGVLGVGGWYGYQALAPSLAAAEKPVEVVHEPKEYSLDLSSADWQVRTGDRILVPYQGGELVMSILLEDRRCRIRLSDLSAEDILLFQGDEKILPGGEGIPVIGIKLVSLEKGAAWLQVTRTDVETQEQPEDDGALLPESPAAVKEAEKILLSGLKEPESFTLNAQFNSYSLFRYQADGGTPVEKYYRDGDRIRLDVDRQLMIWGSSAGAVSFSVSGENMTPGKSGEVLVKLIQWVKNDEGKYDLVLFPVQ